MSADVAAAFQLAFTPTFVYVATWFRVQAYPGNIPNEVNTFQATLASDNAGRSFVTFW